MSYSPRNTVYDIISSSGYMLLNDRMISEWGTSQRCGKKQLLPNMFDVLLLLLQQTFHGVNEYSHNKLQIKGSTQAKGVLRTVCLGEYQGL